MPAGAVAVWLKNSWAVWRQKASGLYRLTAFVLDENGGVQVCCRINVTPVSQSWVHVPQRISMPHSVLEVRCDVSFHNGSPIQE